MGATPFPAKLILHLAKAHGTTTFVETGTYHGVTTRWAAAHFLTVHTIELSEDQARETTRTLGALPNVQCHVGNSRDILPRVCGQPAVYYLDGHWSGGDTAGEQDQCPLLDELRCLESDDIIVIDDARLFLRTPPLPLNAEQWPTIQDISDVLPLAMFMQVIDDVIVLVPETLRSTLIAFLREEDGRP